MSNEIQIFKNDEFGAVRTVTIDNEPWFVGKDVAEALGYVNPQKAIRDHIDDEDKTLNESFTVNGTQGILINESGLYSLILSSKLPTAKKFKRWVTSEVLPSIRKTGGYMAQQLSNEEILSKALDIQRNIANEAHSKIKELDGKIEKLQAANDWHVDVIRELTAENRALKAVKASYMDVIMMSPGNITNRKLAQDYGRTEDEMFELLKEHNIIEHKQDEAWLLTAEYRPLGYIAVDHSLEVKNLPVQPHFKFHLSNKWTQRGRLFVYETLKEYDILPVMEVAQ